MEELQTIKEDKKNKNFIKKINWHRVLEYTLPAIVTVVFYVIAMAIKGVYPFGLESIGYIDYNDGLVPAYTALWDVLHGKLNIFVSWDLGAGGSFISSAILNSFLSPLCWIVALFPRSAVIYSVAFVVIIMLALMSTTAYLCFKKYFPNVNKYILLLFSLVWTFSGWTMTHYTNVGWLNIMILLPLLLISAKKLVEEGKIFWFVLILTYMLMLSYYITYMVLVGVVIVSLLYICILAKEKKKVASNLFYAIIISILISLIVFIPSCITSLQAHRFSGTSETANTVNLFNQFFSKLSILITYALPVVFFVRLMFTYKKDKKNVLFFMLSFIICGIGLIIEPINQMWHTGSYYSFPFRYSFVLIMILIFASLYYINKYYTNATLEKVEEVGNQVNKKSSFNYLTICLVISLVFSILFTLVLAYFGAIIIPYKEIPFNIFVLYLMVFVTTYLAIELALRIKNKKFSFAKIPGGIIIFVLCLVQVLSFATGVCGISSGSNPERVKNALILDVGKLEDGYKIKDREALYNYNFPYLIEYPSMSTWIHISNEDQYQGYYQLGYQSYSTMLFSAGGTVVSDVLLGNRYVLSRYQLDSSYYNLIDSFDYVSNNDNKKVNEVVYLYELNFNFDLVYTTNVNLKDLFNDEEVDWLENHNKLYKALYNDTNDIITSIQYSAKKIDDENIKLTINTPMGQNIYLQNKFTNYDYEITYGDYTYSILNGLIDLGTASSDTLEIIISSDDIDLEKVLSNISFASLNIEKFKESNDAYLSNNSTLNFDNESIEVSIDNINSDKYIFIPYTYLNNMIATINDVDVEIVKTFDTFMMLELLDGENNITITYKPQLFSICAIVTVVSLIIFVVFSILNHKFKLSNKKGIVWIGFVGGCVILLAVGVLVYIKPFINFIVLLFS